MQVVGHLRADVARELGLTEDVAVAPGSGDNQMSALGAGAVKEGAWVVSLGTSGDTLCPAISKLGKAVSLDVEVCMLSRDSSNCVDSDCETRAAVQGHYLVQPLYPSLTTAAVSHPSVMLQGSLCRCSVP